MRRLKLNIDRPLTDDERRQIWIGDGLQRNEPTTSIYAHWYSPESPMFLTCLPALMTRTDWWPTFDDDDDYEDDVPKCARNWLQMNWPTLIQDFEELAELCQILRPTRLKMTDKLSAFWSDYVEAAHVLFVARYAPEGLDLWLSSDPEAIIFVNEFIEEEDLWIEHITWFFEGGIHAHAPRPTKVVESGDAGAPPPPPRTGPTP